MSGNTDQTVDSGGTRFPGRPNATRLFEGLVGVPIEKDCNGTKPGEETEVIHVYMFELF